MARPLHMAQTDVAKKRISEAQKLRYQMLREELAKKNSMYFNETDDRSLNDYEKLQMRLRKSIVSFTNSLLELASYAQKSKHESQLLSDKIDEAIKASLDNVINESKQVRQ